MDPRERFLQAAVEPLADNAELQLAARQQLEEQLSPEATAEDLANAAERLERRGTGRWRWVWAGVVLVGSVVMMAGSVRSFIAGWQISRSYISPIGSMSVEPKHPFREQLADAERLLLFGDESALKGDDIWRPLWESDPDNPMFYGEYAIAHERTYDALPPDFIDTGERLDPGNGWFRLKKATEESRKVVERDQMSWTDREKGVPATWTVKDKAELAKRIDLLKQAARAQVIDSHQAGLRRLRIDALPESRDLLESIQWIAYAAGMSVDMSQRHLSDLIAAEARRCQREGDKQGFEDLARVWERVTDWSLDEGTSLVEALIAGANMHSTLPPMADAAAAVEVDAALWASRAERVRARRERLNERATTDELAEMVERHGSMLAALSLPMVARQAVDPPELTKQDLLPATRVDHALVARALAAANWQVLAIFAGISLFAGMSQAALVKRLGRSLGRLPGPGDALWIGFGGVVVPVLIYLGLRYGTPLARLDWGPSLTLYAVPVSHFVGLLLMLTLWPVALASDCASKAGSILRWRALGWWAWSAMLAPVAGMLCFSFAVPPGDHSLVLGIVGIAFGGWSLVWLLVQVGASISGKVEDRVRGRVISAAVRPAWLGGTLVMAGFTFLFHTEERRWFAQDEVMHLTPGFTAYEAKVTEAVKRELREVLE